MLSSNYATRFYEILGRPTADSFIAILAKKENYQFLCTASLWLHSSLRSAVYLKDIFSDVVSSFIQLNSVYVKDYLEAKTCLGNVIQLFINFVFAKPSLLDKNTILSCLEHGDKVTDNILFNAIANKYQHKDQINILGFGSGNGRYEQRLAQFIKRFNVRSNINLYGFDPYTDVTKSDIQLLGAKDLESHLGLQFDLIIARWVLHHVEVKDRWEMFIRCANFTKQGALIFILEEGDFYAALDSLPQLIYRFFLACVDIIINAGLRPNWFLATAPHIGKNFFVDYLCNTDINAFENKFNFKFEKVIIPISDGHSFGQSLITYQII